MTETPIYIKHGRRYVEIGKHHDYQYFHRNGAYLMIVKPGVTSTVRCVDIDAAGVLAAMRIASDAIVTAISDANQLKPSKQSTPITQQQRDLLDQLEATGFNTSTWSRGSIMEVVEAGMRELKAVMDSQK